MKKISKKVLMSILSFSMILANFTNHVTPVSAKSNEAKIYIDTDQVITKDFEGFGVQWDPSDLFDYTDEQWDSFYEKASFLKPNIMRVMLHDGDSYVVGFDQNDDPIYDWDSVMMKRVYKILDFAEQNNIPVMLGEWRSISERGMLSYTETGKKVKWDNPIWQQMIMDCLEHLIVEKGYTCIKYYNMVNEPNYYVRDNGGTDQASYDMWKKGIIQLREMMDNSDVEAIKKIKIVGPDVYDKQEAWIKQAKSDELKDKIELTEVHRYAPKSEVESGLVETKLKNWKNVAEEMDPNVKEEGFALGEMGLSGTGPGDCQLNGRYYDYGVDIFDYALQATRAGLKFGSVWGFEDSMHVQHNDIVNTFKDRYGPAAKTEDGRAYKVHTPTGDPKIDNDIKIWGFWNELGEEMAAQNANAGLTNKDRANTVKASDEQLKPWYYTWSMFCRYMPAGMQILETTDSGVDQVRATAGIIPRGKNKADLSIAVVNTSSKEQKVHLNIPNADGKTTLNQYYYFDGDRSMNEKGQLEVYDTLENVDLSKGLDVTMPANTCMIFTTLGYNQESHPMAFTTGKIPEVTDVEIYEKSLAEKLTVGETYQLKTRFTPSISKATMEWKVVDYFGNESDIAVIDDNGNLVPKKAGQFKVVGNVKGHPEINDTLEIVATSTKILRDDLSSLDVGVYEGIVRDDNSANFNNVNTIKRSDGNANGKPGIITYQADNIFDFEFKAFSLHKELPTSNNFVVEVSKDGQNWDKVDCDFKMQDKLNSNWYPFIITPKNIDINANYQNLRVVLNSKGYKTYDPQFGGGIISHGTQTASEIRIDNEEKFVVTNEQLQFNVTVLPKNVSQDVTYKVVENNGEPTNKAIIDENGLLTAKETGDVTVVIETFDQSLSTYYPLQIVGGYFVDDINNFDLMYDYGEFTYENDEKKFGEAPLLKRNDNTPQSIVYAFDGIQKAEFEAFSNSTFTENQASIYMSEDGLHYDLIDAEIVRIGTAPGASDFSKYKITATVDTEKYNFVKFEIKNDSKIYNPMIAKAEIVYNGNSNVAKHINVVEDRIITNVGKEVQIDVRFSPLNTTGKITFESVNPKIAIVDESGMITALSTGSTIVKVIMGNDYVDVPVNVLEENFAFNKNVEVTSSVSSTGSLAVDGNYSTRWGSKQSQKAVESITVDLGKVQLIDTVKIFWETARAEDYNLEIAGEDKQFKIVKEMRGIQGVYDDILSFDPVEARYVKMSGKKPATKYGYSIYELEVYNNTNYINVENVELLSENDELYVGQQMKLGVTVSPKNATCSLPIYTSSNEHVVKIINGEMIAVKPGKTTITADVDNKKATLDVEVVDENKFKIANELISLNIENGVIKLPEFENYILTIFSSTNDKVIGLDGIIHNPVNNTAVDVVVKVEDKDSSRKNDYALSRPITVHIIGDDTLFKQLEALSKNAMK